MLDLNKRLQKTAKASSSMVAVGLLLCAFQNCGEFSSVTAASSGSKQLASAPSSESGSSLDDLYPGLSAPPVQTSAQTPVQGSSQSGAQAGVAACPSNAMAFSKGQIGNCACSAAATKSGAVYGSGTYTADSSLCRAALHAGAVAVAGGIVKFTVSNGVSSYSASSVNGVSSSAWGAYGASLSFLGAGAQAAPAQQPTPPAKYVGQTQDILQMYSVYLPGCLTNERLASWQGFFANGGTIEDFVTTIETVANEVPRPSCMTMEAQIRTLFNQFLPGCLTPEKQTYWEAWFGRGGSMSDYVLTLKNVAAQRPSCMK